ncbi:MAG TPA: DUF3105 domain-containing protein [Acidimicrobiales bacterium]|nr:DUF3105 domain-containing protein [Acidimicrobiales bacterium]
MKVAGARALTMGALAALAALLSAGACGGPGDGSGSPRPTSSPPVLSGPGSCREDDRYDSEGRGHRAGVTYKVNPPAGGDHDPRTAKPGVYQRGQAPDGALVHSMERGDVVVWHTVLDPSDEAKLNDLVRRFPKVVLVVPRPGMDAPIVATRWHRRLLCQGIDIDALAAWIDANKNLGPEVFKE